jgi:hypothetical protein
VLPLGDIAGETVKSKDHDKAAMVDHARQALAAAGMNGRSEALAVEVVESILTGATA